MKKYELPENTKIKLDDATYGLVKDSIKRAYSKVENTPTGFVYTVDFEKQP